MVRRFNLGSRASGVTTLLTTVVAIAVVVSLGAQSSERATMQLQAAIKLEVVDGNLQAAVGEFRKLADNADPSVAAEALVHLAAAYEKLGNPEARPTYERVVRLYAGQPKPFARANAWLAAHPTQSVAGNVRNELVWSGKGVDLEGNVSPDGRYLSYVDWQDHGVANLAVRDLKTGESRLLTRDGALDGYAAGSLFSPDGKQIAYVWEDNDQESIRIVGVDGGRVRELVKRSYSNALRAWSPDGKQIVAVHFSYDDQTSQIILINTSTGTVVPLKSTGNRHPLVGGFSPDGRYLLYSYRKEDGSTTGGVYVIATDLSRQTALIEDAANYRHPMWSPDGSQVLFVSDRSGGDKLYAMRVADGRPDGNPEILPVAVSTMTTTLGFTRSGALYYGTMTFQDDGYIADFDPATLSFSHLSPVTDRVVGRTFQPDMSPDGRHVVFFRRTTERPNGPAEVILRTVATGDERVVANVGVVYPRDRGLQWFPDNRTILLQETVWDPSPGAKKFRSINVETGETKLLFDGPSWAWRTAALSPDGTTLYYSVWEKRPQSETGTLRLIRRNLATGQESELYKAESDGIGCFGLTIAPDGQTLAFSVNVDDKKNPRVLLVVPASGGSPRELIRTDYEGLLSQGAMAFTPDGRRILARGRCTTADARQGQERRPLGWCAFPLDGGAPTPTTSTVPNASSLSQPMISADGRRITFTTGSQKNEVWVAHNLLPIPSASR